MRYTDNAEFSKHQSDYKPVFPSLLYSSSSVTSSEENSENQYSLTYFLLYKASDSFVSFLHRVPE